MCLSKPLHLFTCTTIYYTLKCILSYFDYECSVYLHSLNKVKLLYFVCLSEFILPRLLHIYVLPHRLKSMQERMATVLGVHAYHSYSYYECWHDCQPVSVCPKILANIIPSNQVIPEQHTAYHTLTISHTLCSTGTWIM